MNKILVNAPTGMQELIEVGEGGGYFDAIRVVWDERTDGELPAITLGGMKRVGNNLVFDPKLQVAHKAAKDAEDKVQIKAAIKSEMVASDLSIIRALTEGDTVRIKAHIKAQEDRRAKLK